jgi:hypothetical protein
MKHASDIWEMYIDMRLGNVKGTALGRPRPGEREWKVWASIIWLRIETSAGFLRIW